jgi:hypothetical protein
MLVVLATNLAPRRAWRFDRRNSVEAQKQQEHDQQEHGEAPDERTRPISTFARTNSSRDG